MFRRLALGCVCIAVLALAGAAAAAGVDITATEGQSFTKKVADTGACGLSSAQISWGDGTPSSAGTSDGGSGINGTHTYADEGTYNGTVSYVCSQFGGVNMASFQATVQDAPLTAAGRDVSGTAGQALTGVVAHFQDANPGGAAGDFSAQVTWGDGSTSAGSVAAAPGGGFDVSGTHTYPAAGTFGTNTSITDVGGSSASASASAHIAAAPAQRPSNTRPPLVSGEARERESLTTTPGDWNGSPSAYQYQWLRCDAAGDNCADIPGATASTYSPVHADVGAKLRARVRATNPVGTSLPADSAPTFVVAPLVVRARFTISPSPTCTGLKTTLDGSDSKTPNPPITSYKYTEAIVNTFNNPRAGHQYDVADSTNPRAVTTFGWTNSLGRIIPGVGNDKIAVAEPRIVTLTVTDKAGGSASYSLELDFAQTLSSQPRSVCPKQRRTVTSHFSPSVFSGLTATKKSVTARLPCISAADCAGALRVSARTHRRGKPVVIASSPFFTVQAHHSATISARLTAAGQALINRGKPVAATAQLTTIGTSGRSTSQSHRITLGPAKRR